MVKLSYPRKCLLLLTAVVTPVAALEMKQYHTVKRGECLSRILQELGFSPYKVLQQTIRLNPPLQAAQGNLIYPGQKIFLGPLYPEQIKPPLVEEAPAVASTMPPSPETATGEEASPIASREIAKTAMPASSQLMALTTMSYVGVKGRDGEGSSGQINSSASPTLRVSWVPRLTDRWSVEFGGSYQRLSFQKAASSEVEARQLSVNRLFFGSSYAWSERLKLEAQLGQGEQVFYRAETTGVYEIDKVSIPYGQVSAFYDLSQDDDVRFGVRAGARVHSSFDYSSYKGGVGHGYFGAFQVDQRLGDFTMFAETFYGRDSFPISSVTYVKSELGVGLGIKYKLGE